MTMTPTACAVLGLILLATPFRSGVAQERVAFVTVALDPETRQADAALARYLKSKTNLQFDPQETGYQKAIHEIAGWAPERGPYLARMTPYAYVAAEMLGANFEILATYNSKATHATTYHSYFVVNRDSFANHPNPGLADLLDFLRERQRLFIYHDKFSTSSYFLPSLYFRSHRIFTTAEAPDTGDHIIPIRVTRIPVQSSSSLVDSVANGKADLAAVWDGTKQKFATGAVGQRVYFIQLPDAVPNDLLVYSRWTAQSDEDALRLAIRSMNRDEPGQINIGDFKWWEEFKEADAARLALANLRRLAAEHPAPVPVLIQRVAKGTRTIPDQYLEAARQAVRLSGSEFVLFDEDYYRRYDAIWTLTLIHDGAVLLTTAINGSDLPPQQFQISFTDVSDLTKRIGTLIHSRMHRIRYIWPYEEISPKVIRDVDFSVPVGTLLKTQKIAWLDPERNSFRDEDQFEAEVTAADFFKFSLAPRTPGGTALALDPMSNVAYRVILVRPSEEPLLFKVLTGIFIALLGGAAVGCALDLRRREKRAATLPLEQLVPTETEALVKAHHATWKNRTIRDAGILWCDRPQIEEFIEELRTGGPRPGVRATRSERRRAAILARIPVLRHMLGGPTGFEFTEELMADPSKVGDRARLEGLINFLVDRQLFSPFLGRPAEFDALNAVAYQVFEAVDPGRPNGGNPEGLLRPDSPVVLRYVSRQFGAVLDEGQRKPSLFRMTWDLVKVENERRYLMVNATPLPCDVTIDRQGATIRGLKVECHVPANEDLEDRLNTPKLDAWLLGRIQDKRYETLNGARYLCLQFRMMAVLRA